MTYGDADYKVWLSNLKVGSKVILAGKDCPAKERGQVRTVEGVDSGFNVMCQWPEDHEGVEIDVFYFGSNGGLVGMLSDYYLMPIETLVHKLKPSHTRDAAYIASKPGHGTQADVILQMIRHLNPTLGVCMHHVEYLTSWQHSTISARLNRLQGGKNHTEFPVLIKPAERQKLCRFCKGKSKIVPTHYVEQACAK